MMLHGSMQARATELLPDKRATAVSFFVFLLFMGQSLGAIITGHLIGALGFHRAFLVQGAGILVLGLWVGGMLARHRHPRHLARARRS
jgi:predicted MFS family arabinose efflux permease